jgi:hypothetical protein
MAWSISLSAFGPARRPVAGVDGDHDVAHLAARLGDVADRLRDVALGDRDSVDRLGHGLLEGAALGGAALALGVHLLQLLLLEPQRLELLLELRHLAQGALLGLVLALLRGRERADDPGLELRERVRAVRRRELLHQVLARTRQRLLHELPHAVLDRGGAAVREELLELAVEMPVLRPEHLLDTLVEVLGDLARTVRELAVQLDGGLLELGLDELRVGARLLAVEHARPDLHGVTDRLHGIVAVLLARADEANGALVLYDEAVDRHAISDHADVRLPEWSGGFHVD